MNSKENPKEDENDQFPKMKRKAKTMSVASTKSPRMPRRREPKLEHDGEDENKNGGKMFHFTISTVWICLCRTGTKAMPLQKRLSAASATFSTVPRQRRTARRLPALYHDVTSPRRRGLRDRFDHRIGTARPGAHHIPSRRSAPAV